ncbi:hypothetical protein GSI_12021 [Ganoderma sinense ZZ0214-1]|uniref:BTB domain-containing protein n=1 Tax=Ganoderma sinense ZZ0214-1 TaxID=1077348 RepID=A0A2G8RXM3_9APHY|nr:hypothetical protein GSI_12021 [Ganoderma sinense ZZ0214-1]
MSRRPGVPAPPLPAPVRTPLSAALAADSDENSNVTRRHDHTRVAKNVEFRLYRALLVDCSPVLKTLFAEQHPSRLEPIDEHHSIPCPVFRLTDSPQDLRHVLRAFVSRRPMSFLEEEPTQPSFNQISAFIRLGQKYEMGELAANARQFLKRHYTDDVAAWIKASLWEPSGWEDNVAIGVVNLARLINEPSLLPTALMGCVYMEQDVVRGFEREDGTREMLALDDLGRCIKANRTIRETHVTAILRVFEDTVAATCTREKGCKAMLRLALRRAEERLGWIMKSSPFWTFHQLVRNIPKELETCEECTAMVEERYTRDCQSYWTSRSRGGRLSLWRTMLETF